MKESGKLELFQGTLDLLVLRVLAQETLHGYGISQRIAEFSDSHLQADEGSLYPCLYRMERRGWICSEIGPSENNRRARYYHLTRQGRAHLRGEEDYWRRFVYAVSQVLERSGGRK